MLINKHLYGTSCLQMTLQSFFISLMCQVSVGSKCLLSTSPEFIPLESRLVGSNAVKTVFLEKLYPKAIKEILIWWMRVHPRHSFHFQVWFWTMKKVKYTWLLCKAVSYVNIKVMVAHPAFCPYLWDYILQNRSVGFVKNFLQL